MLQPVRHCSLQSISNLNSSIPRQQWCTQGNNSTSNSHDFLLNEREMRTQIENETQSKLKETEMKGHGGLKSKKVKGNQAFPFFWPVLSPLQIAQEGPFPCLVQYGKYI